MRIAIGAARASWMKLVVVSGVLVALTLWIVGFFAVRHNEDREFGDEVYALFFAMPAVFVFAAWVVTGILIGLAVRSLARRRRS